MSESTDAPNMSDSSNNTNDDVPDMSTSKDSHDPATAHKRANEIMNRLIDGRSAASSIVLTTPYEEPYDEVRCAVELDSLDLKTRWDCVSALPDAMFSAAGEVGEDGNLGDGVELEANIMPGGESMVLMREVVIETLTAEGLDQGDLRSMVENDLKDDDLIEIGMRLIEMSLDRGEITGFRFED